MHIPDGFIDAKTAVTTAALACVGVGFALRQVRRELPARKVPLLGLGAAFLFVAQMVNFPVAAGTSGHLIGSALIAALLGPSAAIVVLTSVLMVQCFLFADGGVLALGANIFNLGIVAGYGGHAVFRLLHPFMRGPRGRIQAMILAGWASTVLAAISCAGQLAWSGTVSWPAAFTAMTGVHLVIGVGEGLTSALVMLAIQRARPELLSVADQTEEAGLGRDFVRYGLLLSLGLALFVAPFASPWPDGLESVADKLGFGGRAVESGFPALAPDYRAPGVHWAVGATALAGVGGALVVYVIALLAGRWLVPADKSGQRSEAVPQ